MSEPDKTCAVCGRTITWRKKWERSWADVRYCSDACRKRKKSAGQHEAQILAMLAVVPRGESIALSDGLKEAGRRLVAKGAVDFIQDGHSVDASTAKGPVRVRHRR